MGMGNVSVKRCMRWCARMLSLVSDALVLRTSEGMSMRKVMKAVRRRDKAHVCRFVVIHSSAERML